MKTLTNHFDIIIRIIGVLFISGIILSLKFLDINFTNLIVIGITLILVAVSIILGITFSIIYVKWIIPWSQYIEKNHPVTLITVALLAIWLMLFAQFYQTESDYAPSMFISNALLIGLLIFIIFVWFYISKSYKNKKEKVGETAIEDLEFIACEQRTTSLNDHVKDNIWIKIQQTQRAKLFFDVSGIILPDDRLPVMEFNGTNGTKIRRKITRNEVAASFCSTLKDNKLFTKSDRIIWKDIVEISRDHLGVSSSVKDRSYRIDRLFDWILDI